MVRGAFTMVMFDSGETLQGTENRPVYQGTRGLPCRRLFSVFASILLLFAILPTATQSQQVDIETRYRLAQALELSSEFERAAAVYKELLVSDPQNPVALDGLQRMWIQLKRYDETVQLIRTRLAHTPGDPALRATLGSVYYRAGNEAAATVAWDSALAIDPKQTSTYRIVASVLAENRLLDRAADVYRRGRVALNDPHAFVLELAQLLSAGMDYANATREYIGWLRLNPMQLSFLQSRMGSWMAKDVARTTVLNVVRDELRRKEDLPLLQLLGWVATEAKDYDLALTTYRRIDELSTPRGSALVAFANRALQNRAFRVAVDAYREAIAIPLPAQSMPEAEFGEARALEELGAAVDTSSGIWRRARPTEVQPLYAGPIARYRAIIERYPHTGIASQSLYRIGLIQYTRLDDLDGALASFQQVLNDLPAQTTLRYSVALVLGQIQVVKGDTARATRQFLLVAGVPDALSDQTDEALFRLAEIDFYAGRFDDATRRLEGLSANLKADFANDALALQAVLQENAEKHADELREYAHALFLGRQQKNTEAIALLGQIVQADPKGELADDALMETARLQASAGFIAEAIASYQRVLTEFATTSISLDQAQFRLAEAYDLGARNVPGAISAYEQLLRDHPNSIYGDIARKRVRELRGDSL
jgi:tetratricopeptide (TPR) repeat protein